MSAMESKRQRNPTTPLSLRSMRAVLQKCSEASVVVDGQVVSKIGRGMMVLVGICNTDTIDDATWLANSILKAKLFADADDESKYWKRNVVDIDGEVLLVSQFTLYGQLRKGAKPDFHLAMKAETSKQFYQDFVESVRTKYQSDRVKDGVFGAMMDVSLVNEGPVTLILDSKQKEPLV